MQLINRELSVLEFNKRLLAQAQDNNIPLLERLRYICIVSSNLDEFFETRYANVILRMEQDKNLIDECGNTLIEIRDKIHQQVHDLVLQQYNLYQSITQELAAHGVNFYQSFNWNLKQKKWAKEFFIKHILPVLMPIALDPAHPFPKVLNKSLNFAITVEGDDVFKRKADLIILPAPRSLPRFVHMPSDIAGTNSSYIFLSSFIQAFTALIFPHLNITGCYQFRITRNSDVVIDKHASKILDLRRELKGHLRTRNFQDAMRLEVSHRMPNYVVAKLLQTQEENIVENILDSENPNIIYWYRVNGPVNLVRLLPLIDELQLPLLKFSHHTPYYPKDLMLINWFKKLKNGDILLHLPYESFDPLLEFLNQSSQDKHVVSIQMTLYRTGQNSPIIQALINAAQKGKEVTVILELFARFDEETNIDSSSELERYGVHVVYGVVGYKCHAKILLVTRNELDENNGWNLKQYAQIGTGNYHIKNAKLYTDFCFFTSDPLICQDVHNTIRAITASAFNIEHSSIIQAPLNLHSQLLYLIKEEEKSANQQGRIIIKVNAIDEMNIINALYSAAINGVKITLIVRGICAIQATENIEIISTIGRFLEHHRIFYFFANAEEKTYIGSSDLMHRNCFKRIEVLVPINDKRIKQRVYNEGLKPHLEYNSWRMNKDNSNSYSKYNGVNNDNINSQTYLISQYANNKLKGSFNEI